MQGKFSLSFYRCVLIWQNLSLTTPTSTKLLMLAPNPIGFLDHIPVFGIFQLPNLFRSDSHPLTYNLDEDKPDK